MSEDQSKDQEQDEYAGMDDLIAESTFVGDLMRVVVDILKAAPKTWQELSETEQETYLNSIEAQVKHVSQKAIRILSSAGRTSLVAEVDSVTFKDGVKAVMKLPKCLPGVYDLADAEGQEVLIVVSGAEALLHSHDLPEADPDQPAFDYEEDAA